jgi:hypothetical protein
VPNSRSWRRVAIASLAVVGGVAIAAAQTATTQSGGARAPFEELLTEVRGLRAEVNQAASASIRAQLIVARLQLQEQRINVVAGQLAEVRRLITTLESGQIPLTAELKRIDDSARTGNVPPEEQKRLEMNLGTLKAQLAQMQRQERQLRLQETELSSQLTSEQGRWIDFNSRLDDIERQLLKP